MSGQCEFKGVSDDIKDGFLISERQTTSHISLSIQTDCSLPSIITPYFTPPFSIALRNKVAKSAVYLCRLVSLKEADIFPASRREKSSRELTSLNNLRAFR